MTAPPSVGGTETALYGAKVLGQATGRPGVYMALRPRRLPTDVPADPPVPEEPGGGGGPLMLLHGMAWLNSHYRPR